MAQLRTGFVLSMESAYQRMASLGINLLLHDRIITPRETIAQMKGVKLKDVNRVANYLLGKEPKLAFVGKHIAKNLNRKGTVPHGQA
jgi:predicted Zn-dependent peptidase